VRKAEYRSQPTNVRGPIYIYAGNKVTLGYEDAAMGLPRGVVIGTVEIVDCTWEQSGGCYAWNLANPERLPTPRKPERRPNPCVSASGESTGMAPRRNPRWRAPGENRVALTAAGRETEHLTALDLSCLQCRAGARRA